MNKVISVSRALVKIAANDMFSYTMKNVNKARGSSSTDVLGNTKQVKTEYKPPKLEAYPVENPISRLNPGGINAY